MKLASFLDNVSASSMEQETFASRIQIVLHQKKRSRSWLASELGISKQAMQYILDKSKKPNLVVEIADALTVNPTWLETGEGSMTVSDSETHLIPLLSSKEICSLNPGQVPVTSPRHISSSSACSKNCFATTLTDDSMSPLFQSGSVLIFDRTKNPKTGAYILLKSLDTGMVLFRQYIQDASDQCFKPLNVNFDMLINKKAIILGVLVEARTLFI